MVKTSIDKYCVCSLLGMYSMYT